MQGDYAIEIREELAHRKNRTYDTHDSLNRRIRVKFKPPDTWIKATQHTYDHMKTAYARDDKGWHVVDRDVEVKHITKLPMEVKVCIVATQKEDT